MIQPLSSPTPRLVAGLVITLAAIATFSYYSLRQIGGLRDLQERLIDRNRRDSLQLLRIQNDLHLLGFALRDMITSDEPYPMTAWKSQFDRIRADLEDAVRQEAQLAPDTRRPEEQQYFAAMLNQLWISLDQTFERTEAGEEEEARALVRDSLQAQQSSLSTTVARLLVQNNEAEERAAQQVEAIYGQVERNTYYFIAAVVVMISLTSLYLIYSNRRVFQRLEVLSAQRSELARKVIGVQEEVLWSISRELHDEFGQILTAIGALLARAERNPAPELQSHLTEVRQIVQETLDKTRSLSQALHPAILDTGGLEQAIEWYVPVFEKQTGIAVQLEKQGTCGRVPHQVAIHVYRILQEALNNLAKHSKSQQAWVRVQFSPERLRLDVEDRGVGMPSRDAAGRGIGMIGMVERAELLKGNLEVLRPEGGGTLVRLQIPLLEASAGAR
jgi:signal transduction histidine kinase